MQNALSKFSHNSFQSSNFVFVHFSLLSFIFIQLKTFHQFLLKFFEKKNEKYSSIINLIFFLFKKLEEKFKKIEKLITIYNKN